MDAADRLLHSDRLVTSEEDKLLLNAKTSGVKCDIINECKVFLKAEDGGGDAQLNTTATMTQDNQGRTTKLDLELFNLFPIVAFYINNIGIVFHHIQFHQFVSFISFCWLWSLPFVH